MISRECLCFNSAAPWQLLQAIVDTDLDPGGREVVDGSAKEQHSGGGAGAGQVV